MFNFQQYIQELAPQLLHNNVSAFNHRGVATNTSLLFGNNYHIPKLMQMRGFTRYSAVKWKNAISGRLNALSVGIPCRSLSKESIRSLMADE
jgi:hypothetical protein